MYKLENCMEILVEQMFDQATKAMDICQCGKCKLDIMALALNSLQPRYAVTRQGAVYVKLNILEQQFSTDILSAIVKGAMTVKKSHQHEEE